MTFDLIHNMATNKMLTRNDPFGDGVKTGDEKDPLKPFVVIDLVKTLNLIPKMAIFGPGG